MGELEKLVLLALGGLIGAVLTHWSTSSREKRKDERAQQASRLALLRSKLESVVELVLAVERDMEAACEAVMETAHRRLEGTTCSPEIVR